MAWPVVAESGTVRQLRHGEARTVRARHVMAWQVWLCRAVTFARRPARDFGILDLCSDAVRQAWLGKARSGQARCGWVGLGEARQARITSAGRWVGILMYWSTSLRKSAPSSRSSSTQRWHPQLASFWVPWPDATRRGACVRGG